MQREFPINFKFLFFRLLINISSVTPESPEPVVPGRSEPAPEIVEGEKFGGNPKRRAARED